MRTLKIWLRRVWEHISGWKLPESQAYRCKRRGLRCGFGWIVGGGVRGLHVGYVMVCIVRVVWHTAWWCTFIKCGLLGLSETWGSGHCIITSLFMEPNVLSLGRIQRSRLSHFLLWRFQCATMWVMGHDFLPFVNLIIFNLRCLGGFV